MRWQYYRRIENESMLQDLSGYYLSQLYEREREIEAKIKELREKEPSSKRKYESKHQVWFSLCQGYIDELKNTREAICAKKLKK